MMRPARRTALQLSSFVALALAVQVVAGCGVATGNVSGKVTYKNKPLNAGTVTFIGQNNAVLTSVITDDGRYSISKCPVGEVKITISTPAVGVGVERAKMDPGKMGGAPAGVGETVKPVAHVTVPSDYNSPETSKLTYTVIKGDQAHDLDLK